MKIGCHAVLFTDSIATNTVPLLGAMRKAGAQGVEIGARFFGLEKSGELRDALKATDMRLSGLHSAFTLTGLLDEPDKIEQQLAGAARFLQDFPDKNIIATGGVLPEMMNAPNLGDDRLITAEGAETVARNLNKIAAGLREQFGVQLHYHNHNWEFKNDAVIFRALGDYAPDLCFALDTGWAAVSGYNPVQLIRETLRGRIRYLHLRDYRKSLVGCQNFQELQNGYLELGQGEMDYPELLRAAHQAVGDTGWVVVEYEKGPVEIVRYQEAVRYVQGILSGLQG